MFNRIKNRVLTAVSPDLPALPSDEQIIQPTKQIATYPRVNNPPNYQRRQITNNNTNTNKSQRPDKFTYGRPAFLQLMTYDELKASADHNVRPIIVPRDINVMPWCAGYAECVNSGKSEWNEDQAAFHRCILTHPTKKHSDLPYIYFGMFDGHAGYGAALAAAQQFHYILHEKLVDIIDLLMPSNQFGVDGTIPQMIMFHKSVSRDELIVGALESAFHEMDTLLAEDRNKYRNAGGCTALAAIFIFGKMFVANAGDSRAILCQRMSVHTLRSHSNSLQRNFFASQAKNLSDQDGKSLHAFPIPFSYDHTPDTERTRLMTQAKLNPTLIGSDYVPMEYAKRPMVKDLGTRILYRQGQMKGWAYKTLTRDDLKNTIVTGEGKRSRLLGTIGVTRGFGDHDLRALGTGVPIKPFLSCHPEVVYRDLTKIISIPSEQNEDGDYGLLIMATDGLWDVADPESVCQTVFETLNKFPTEKHRYTMIAQELVARSRGRVNDAGHWRLTTCEAAATVDDISVLVIPVHKYFQEFVDWERKCYDERASEPIPRIENGVESEAMEGVSYSDTKCDLDNGEEVMEKETLIEQ